MSDVSTLDNRTPEEPQRPLGGILVPLPSDKPATNEPPKPQFRRGTIILGG